MTSVRGRGQPAQRSQASKVPTSFSSSNKSANGDHKDPLRSNEPGPFEASAEASGGPLQAPPFPILQDPGANHYSQQNLDKII